MVRPFPEDSIKFLCAFEACKQTGFERLSKVEVIKGADWLLK